MSDGENAFPTQDWRPIAEIPVASRMAFALRAESGRIPTRARSVVQYEWNKDQLAVAMEAIANTIEQHFEASGPATVHQTFALAKLIEPDYGETLEDGVRKTLHEMLGRLPSAADLRAAEAIRERFMLDVDLVPGVGVELAIPAHKWAPESIDHIDWERSEHLRRHGPANRKGHKQGYDIEGIEFDNSAAVGVGFVIIQSNPVTSPDQDVQSAHIDQEVAAGPRANDLVKKRCDLEEACREWLREQFAIAETALRAKPWFLDQAMKRIPGLSERAFKRAWADEAPRVGRSNGGRKPKHLR